MAYVRALALLKHAITSALIDEAFREEAKVLLGEFKSRPRLTRNEKIVLCGLEAICEKNFCGVQLLFFMCSATLWPGRSFMTAYHYYKASNGEPFHEQEKYLEKHVIRNTMESEFWPVSFLTQLFKNITDEGKRMRFMEYLTTISPRAVVTEAKSACKALGDQTLLGEFFTELNGKIDERYAGLGGEQSDQLRRQLDELYSRFTDLVGNFDSNDVGFTLNLSSIICLFEVQTSDFQVLPSPSFMHMNVDDPTRSPEDRLRDLRVWYYDLLDTYVRCLLLKSMPILLTDSLQYEAMMKEFRDDRQGWFGRFIVRSTDMDGLLKVGPPGQLIHEKVVSLISTPYSDRRIIHAYYSVLKNCVSKYEDDRWRPLGHYTSLCQAGGTGKTKQLLSLGSETLLFYINLRKHDASGIPGPSVVREYYLLLTCPIRMLLFNLALLEIFSRGTVVEEKRISYLEYAQSMYSEYYGGECPNPLKCFSDLLANRETRLHLKFWCSVESCHQDYVQQYSKMMSASHKSAVIGASSNNSDTPNPGYLEDLVTRFDRVRGIINDAGQNSGVKLNSDFFVLALDEACEMLNGSSYSDDNGYRNSCFQAARYSSRYFRGRGIMVFCDSGSRISNFAPTKSFDYSLFAVQEYDLFEPNMYIPLLGVVTVDQRIRNLPTALRTIRPLDTNFKTLQYNLFDTVDKCRALFARHVSSQPVFPGQDASELYQSLIDILSEKFNIPVQISDMEKLLIKDVPKHLASAISCCCLAFNLTSGN